MPLYEEDLEPITFYEDRYYMFSNFSAFSVYYEGWLWMTSEHAYQAMKFQQAWLQEWIRNQRSAHLAKKCAQAQSNNYRTDWNSVKVSIMRDICRQKLQQHEYIQRKLLETGNRLLVEASPTDSFWGYGHDKKGENYLGRIWMELRNEWRTLQPFSQTS